MMRAYISVSYSKRKLVDKALSAIIDTLSRFNIASFIFVDNYKFNLSEEQEMMQKAMAEIDGCDILIAEVSDKGIGIGIEAGYAKAKGKLVIYIRQRDAEHSTTVSGFSDFQIVYFGTGDLQDQLTDVLVKAVDEKALSRK